MDNNEKVWKKKWKIKFKTRLHLYEILVKSTHCSTLVLMQNEDIKSRKELLNAAIDNNERVWKKKWKIKSKIRVHLYEILVKSTHCSTWVLMQNSFQFSNLTVSTDVGWDEKKSLHGYTKYQMKRYMKSSTQIHSQSHSLKVDGNF